MGVILNTNKLEKISELKRNGKTLVLAGGCFDILHTGHIKFLKNAKKAGDILIILLESDKKITDFTTIRLILVPFTFASAPPKE